MADRFPSIEDLDAGDAPVQTNGSGDGTSFLDRERALLGEDAGQFATAADNAATVEDGEDDLLGGGLTQSAPAGGEELSAFESSFPAVDTTNDNIGPGGTITGSNLPYQPQAGGYTNYAAPADEEETEPIRQWREKRDAEIARRDESSAEKKQETVGRAREDLDSFYENYNKKMDRQRGKVAEEATKFVESIDNTAAGGTAWERIAKIADLHKGGKKMADGSGASKDRMRNLILELAKDERAPGASGV